MTPTYVTTTLKELADILAKEEGARRAASAPASWRRVRRGSSRIITLGLLIMGLLAVRYGTPLRRTTSHTAAALAGIVDEARPDAWLEPALANGH